MVDKGLEAYIKRLKDAGYSEEVIRSELLRSGYSETEIAAVLAKPFPIVIIALVAGVIVFLATGFLFIKAFLTKPIFLSIEASTAKIGIEKGANLVAFITLNASQKRTLEAKLSYRIVDAEGKKISEKSESARFVWRTTLRQQFPTTNLTPGNYVFEVLARYDGKSVSSKFGFTIIERKIPLAQPGIELECPGGCDDANPCTADECLEGKCIHNVITPCCGNLKCETGEQLSCPNDCEIGRVEPSPAQDIAKLASDIAKDQPERAVRLCTTLPVDAADKCFNEIALKIGNPRVCESIFDSSLRDSCFIDFSLKDDFTVCPKIENYYLQQSCYSLMNLKETEKLAKPS